MFNQLRQNFISLLLVCCLPVLLGATNQSQIIIQGIGGELQSNVESRLKTLTKNNVLTSQTDDELKQQIANALYPFGYFKPDIIIQQRNNTVLRITINQGSPLYITHLSVGVIGEGKNNLYINKALRHLNIKQGELFNSKQYESAKQELIDAAEHEGYLHASFDKEEVLIDKAKYTSSITLLLNTGSQYYFGQVQFDPGTISPELLHRYVPFAQGQPYSTDQILAFNSALSGSGYFKSVSIKPQINAADHIIPIDVHTQPVPRKNYSLGLGFGTDTGVRGRLGYHIIPVNRYGHKFNLVALGSLKENSLQAQYVIPGRNPLTDQYDVLGNLSTLNYNAGYSNSFLLSFAQRHNETSFQRVLSLNGLYERFNYQNQLVRQEKLSFFPKATFTWLYRQNQLFSPNGYNLTLSGLTANKAVLSEISFTQVLINAKAAAYIEPLRTRIYLHGIQGFTQIDDIDQMPLSLAQLLGGADNLKGYSYNSIGPGKIMSYAGIELQKETIKNWYLIGFLDTGDVYKPSFKSWQNDVGAGLMWVSPVGPIKIGVAQPVNSRLNPVSGQKPRLVISMGPDL